MKLIIDETTTVDETGVPQTTVWERWDFTTEVARGAAMLDEMAPGWYRELQLTELALESGSRCVLGQLAMNRFYSDIAEHMYGGGDSPVLSDPADEAYSFDYADLCKWLAEVTGKRAWISHDDRNAPPCQHGFNVWQHHPAFPGEDQDYERHEELKRLAWENLTNEWERVIRDRLRNDSKSTERLLDAMSDILQKELATA